MKRLLNGIPYFWREAGSGPLLVLLHGGLAHSGWFQWMMPRLAERYRVVAPDLRGHGRSGHAEGYTWEAYAEDIEALVQLLVGDEPYFLAGHCSGGYIGMLMSARGVRPPAALVGIEVRPKLPAREDAAMWAAARRPMRRFRSLEALERADRLFWRRQHAPFERVRLLLREALQQHPDGTWSSRRDPRTAGQEPFATYELAAQVRCPTLLIRGAESQMLSEIQFLLVAWELARGSFEEMPGVRHYPMIEDPDTTCAMVERFLGEVAALPAATLGRRGARRIG